MHLRAALIALVVTFTYAMGGASAQTIPDDVPEELRPWAGWVLHDVPDLVCPDVAGERVCRWPGTLSITASSQGGAFEMNVYADRETRFDLPGGKRYWPQNVRVDLSDGIVMARGDTPVVRVPAGSHRITGTFVWTSLPDVLPIPSDVGRVELTLGTDRIERPRVDGAGRLSLRDGRAEAETRSEAESVRVSTYRRFSDGIPLVVTTRLRLNVSGRAREVELGKILLAGSRPIAIRAKIPVQVGSEGDVEVYVRPGTHDVEVDAVIEGRPAELVAPTPTPNFYDPHEVWIWVPDETIRSVGLGGLGSVDPDRTSLPDDWKGETTFLAKPGEALALSVKRRGIEEPPPNVLHLDRELWLDLDGTGYTIRDRVTGKLRDEWRLDHSPAAGATLGRVSQSGENLLITEAPGTGLPGVELRDAGVDILAEVRVEDARSSLPIVGWDHDVQSLDATLHLPPGWTLLGGKGVDTMSGTWIESWTLWNFFFVLIIALVVGRLFSWPWAAVSVLALCLAHGQPDAPEWIWIHLIATLALLRVLPGGWWRKGVVAYRFVALVALAVILAPFAYNEIQTAIYPQVSAGGIVDSAPNQMAMVDQTAEFDAAPQAPMESADDLARLVEPEQARRPMKKKLSKRQGWLDSGYSGSKASVKLQQVDPDAVVQTGPGLPTWDWRSWDLDWTGPVGKDHAITLWLLSPTANRALGFIRVALLILLALLLIAPREMYWEKRRRAPHWWRRLFGTGVVLLVAGSSFAGAQRSALAQEPPPAQQMQNQNLSLPNVDAASTDLLDQLRRRIVEASRCPEPCVVASGADIVVTGLDFRMTAEVSAAGETAWTLPGTTDALRIDRVFVDGRPTNMLRRDGDMVAVRLAEGAHAIEVAGTLVDRTTVTVQFDDATRPRRVSFAAEDWSVDGINSSGVPDSSLQLTRSATSQPEAPDAADGAVELPPWYRVDRLVALGLPWQVHTTIVRDDADRPRLVKIPLLEGEKIITEGVRVEGGHALVDFPRGEHTVGYVGEIPIGEQVVLAAAEERPWTENWTVDCSRIWRCSFSGLPPTSIATDGKWRPRWNPWPGETLEIGVRRPQGAAGQPKTVQRVRYTVSPGKRLMQAELEMTIRSSQGDWQEVTLPPEAELQSVKIDGIDRVIRPQDGVVRLPVQPGEAEFLLSWQQPWERKVAERVPAVDIGSDAANVHVRIHRGEDRWLLAVRDSGMNWGPAIGFWPHLLMVLILALLLGAIRRVPLQRHDWMLLAIGMTQLPFVTLLPVVFWFVLLAWRKRNMPDTWWKFDLLQVATVVLTLMALASLYAAVHKNLLVDLDMQVEGMGSTNTMLQWYADRTGAALPEPAILSVPLMVWRWVMFLWALWLVSRIIGWAKWGWDAFSTSGRWRFPRSRGPRTGGDPQPDGSPGKGRSGGHEPGSRPTAATGSGEETDREDESRRRSKPLSDRRDRGASATEMDEEKVLRHARDGELVHVEIDLGGAAGATDVAGAEDADAEAVEDSEAVEDPDEIETLEENRPRVDKPPGAEDAPAEDTATPREEE